MQRSCTVHGPDLQIIIVTFWISIDTCAIVNILPIYKLVRYMCLSGHADFLKSFVALRRGPPVQQRAVTSSCSSCKPEQRTPTHTGRSWGKGEVAQSRGGRCLGTPVSSGGSLNWSYSVRSMRSSAHSSLFFIVSFSVEDSWLNGSRNLPFKVWRCSAHTACSLPACGQLMPAGTYPWSPVPKPRATG